MRMIHAKILAFGILAGAAAVSAQSDYMPFPRTTWPAGIQTAFEIQGEYFGITSTGNRLGAWVVSRNQSSSGTTPNRYGFVFLPGGLLTLPGDAQYGGWDKVTKWQGSGTGSAAIMITTLGDGKNFTLGTSGTSPATTTTGGVTVDSVSGTGETRFIHGRISTDGSTFTLARVVRKSPTANLKPLPAWGAAVSWFDTATAQADLSKWQNQDNQPTLYQSTYLLRGSKTSNSMAHGRGYLHIEFMTCFNPAQTGQNRGNSGVYLQGRYEAQVLDSYGLAGLNDEFGGIYTVRAADVNAALPPTTWHTYDIYFTPRTSGTAGQAAGAAYMTVYANGVKTQDSIPTPNVTTSGLTGGDMTANAPLYLQNHSNQVIYRNIWFIPNVTPQSLPYTDVLAAALPTSIQGKQGVRPMGVKTGAAALGLGGEFDMTGRKIQGTGSKVPFTPTVMPTDK
jgi:hypothetical protein